MKPWLCTLVLFAVNASAAPKERDADWDRWHPPAPPPLALDQLPKRPELPTAPIAPRTRSSRAPSAAESALRRGLDFYASIATRANYAGYGPCAGWCGSYSLDLTFRSGEDSQQLPPDAVKLQAVGTPQVLEAYLAAYLALGDPATLATARAAGNLLLAGQSPHGGWFFEMWVGPDRARGSHVWPGRATWPDPGPEHGTDSATIDDGNTFGPAEALYRLWWVTKDQRYYEGWRRGMDFLLLAQEACGGGFPQAFPSDGYHRYATFNDAAMRTAVDTLLTAYQRTGDRRYYASVLRCAEWVAKVHRAGKGWGAQYDARGEVASARRFEPAGLEPPGTVAAMGILATAYEWTGQTRYLAALPDAATWLERVQLQPGVWARFYHPDTNQPWYRTLQGEDCDFAHAKGGYTWQGRWGAEGLELAQQYGKAQPKAARAPIPPPGDPAFGVTLGEKSPDAREVERIVAAQAPNGCWIGGGRSGRQKQENAESMKYFGSPRFVAHVRQLAASVAAEP